MTDVTCDAFIWMYTSLVFCAILLQELHGLLEPETCINSQ